MGSSVFSFFTFVSKRPKMARDINMNVFWHDFWSCSIKKEDSIRYKWQIKKESKGIQEGILYTGAEKGKRINYPGRVGTVDLEGGAQKAIKNGVNAALAIYPHNLREVLRRRKEDKRMGDSVVPKNAKRPVFDNLHTVGGHVTKLKDSETNRTGKIR